MPCHPARARQLLAAGRARVTKLTPFVIRLIDRTVAESSVQPIEVTLDPGSRTTGIALSRQDGADRHVLALFHLQHRGLAVRDAMTSRSAFRRRRRSANLRYRAPRFDNRTRPAGWLQPSLESRIGNAMTWVQRLATFAPVTSIAGERVRFDMQILQNPEISGVEYQQGTLAGYEVREYLLEKWHHACAYCGVTGVPLQIEHIHPKARGGSNAVSNLAIACDDCNKGKGARDVRDFLANDPKRLAAILAQAKRPLNDAAAVNVTRFALFDRLRDSGLPVTAWSGGRTKWNRTRLGLPKDHALDAACVGDVGEVFDWNRPVLVIKAMGRGAYQRTRLTAFGFPRGYLMRTKQVHGFATGDIVRAVVPKGKKIGTYTGRVAVRASGSFNIQSAGTVVQGISWKHCRVLQRADGYGYAQVTSATRVKGQAHSSST